MTTSPRPADCRCSTFIRCEPCTVRLHMAAGKRFAIRWTQPDGHTGLGDAYDTAAEAIGVIERGHQVDVWNGTRTYLTYTVQDLLAPTVSIKRDDCIIEFASPSMPCGTCGVHEGAIHLPLCSVLLDVEYDGVPLRTLVEREESNRRETGGEFYQCWQMSRMQKDAISVHWSAQLRAKVNASKAAERNVVTYCEED